MKSRKINSKYWDKAWSLVEGCTPVSEGCKHCWSASMEHRFCRASKYDCVFTNDEGKFNGSIYIQKERINIPIKTRKPTVFSIWNDLFHEKVPAEFIIKAFEIMEYCKQHTFLILTKRPERIGHVLFGQEGDFYMGGGDYMPNVWLGTTAENQQTANERIPYLISGADQFKIFLSLEPLLSEIDLRIQTDNTFYPLSLIDQVICGAETGHHARPCNPDWIRSIRDQCNEARIPFFLKQINAKRERILDGREHNKLVWKK